MTRTSGRELTASRRRFVATLAAFGSASGVGRRAASAPSRLKPIGVQLYAVRDLLHKSFEGTLARLAAIGFREVEFAHYHGHSPQPVRAVPWLLVRMATSEYGRLRQVDGDQGRGDRLRMPFMLLILHVAEVNREIGVARPDERAGRGPVAVERVRLRRQMAVRDHRDPHE